MIEHRIKRFLRELSIKFEFYTSRWIVSDSIAKRIEDEDPTVIEDLRKIELLWPGDVAITGSIALYYLLFDTRPE